MRLESGAPKASEGSLDGETRRYRARARGHPSTTEEGRGQGFRDGRCATSSTTGLRVRAGQVAGREYVEDLWRSAPTVALLCCDGGCCHRRRPRRDRRGGARTCAAAGSRCYRAVEDRYPEMLEALDWYLDSGQPETAYRLASALVPFWISTKRIDDGDAWFERAPGDDRRQRRIAGARAPRPWLSRLLGRSVRRGEAAVHGLPGVGGEGG